MNDFSKIWQVALVELETMVSRPNFSTWFKETRIVREEEGVIYLGVPNSFTHEWLEKKFHNHILRILRQMNDGVRSIEYVIEERERGTSPRIERKTSAAPTITMPLQDFYVSKDSNLNTRYTFSNFIVGPFNQLAHAAALAVIKNPGQSYNPLLIYGNTGVGKTHLIQAVGHEISKNFPDKKVYYLTSEQFGNEFLASMQENKAQQFKDKYRRYDVVVMDDVQFFSKKEKFQEELFHFFNIFHNTGRQLIFSSDRHPNVIPDLQDRVRGRFGAGMIVDIPEPDHESRMTIVRTKCGVHGITLPLEAIDFLASAVTDNIRELEGIINVIACQTQLNKREMTLNEVKNIVKTSAKPKKTIAVKDLVKIVCDFYNLDEESVYNKTRRKEVVRPRQMIMYLLREDFGHSFPSIGEKLGGRDHTTVIHSYEKMKNDIKSDQLLSQEVSQLRTML